MTEVNILKWIKTNLAASINAAISGTTYTEDLLGAMACREVGVIISRYSTKPVAEIWPLMHGDYTQRPGEASASYHGFGVWQIDIMSFPDFVASGDWSDPFKCAVKCVKVLEGKRHYLSTHGVPTDKIERGIVAAYNGGEGSVVKALSRGLDVDAYTTGKNYSADVFRMKEIYKSLP